MSAPEWDQGYGLSNSGRWHAIHPVWDTERARQLSKRSRSYCGDDVYRIDTYPNWVNHIRAIAQGDKPAPICKKCMKAAAR